MGNVIKAQITLGDALVNRCWDCIGGRWVYVTELERNLKCLDVSITELVSLKTDVNTSIDTAERQGKKCLDQVQLWLSTVDKKIAKNKKLQEKRQREIDKLCIGGCCSTRCISSYKFGKKVVRRLKEVNDLLKQAKEFKEVAIVALPKPMVLIPVGPTVGLESQIDCITSYLSDKDVAIVGIFGEGEVGKTTLLMEVNNIICNETSSFELVILVDVPKQYMNEGIQNQIGKKIGFIGEEWTRKSLRDKAVDILNVLQKKKFVLLLDNIYKALNLIEIGIPSRNINMDYKVVFTTNMEKICSQMHAQKIVKVVPLDFENSWKLFSDRIGDGILNVNPEIYRLAEEVVRECRGVPRVLINWAHNMASKCTAEDWTDALKSVRIPVIDSQEEIIDDMIAIEEGEDENTTTVAPKVADTNVFGSPITDMTVRELPQYVGRREITNRDRAVAAFDSWEAEDGKDVQAREYVNSLKMKYGDEHSTICLFYNATGSTLKFSSYKDWHGYFIGGLYPKKVENGQWGMFLHKHEDPLVGRSGSSGAIVYSGENASRVKCEWMLAWDNPPVDNQARTKVFTEVREKNHFQHHWATIYNLLSKSGGQRQDCWGGCVSDISVENNNGPFFTAILSLDPAC